MEDFKHLSYASSLCGKCTEVCPVKIDIHKMLLLNRRDAVKSNFTNKAEKTGWYFASKALNSRKLMDYFSGKTKNFFIKLLFKNTWGKNRDLPKVAQKSFSQIWKEGL
jgi:L-lactate dehydrogenase complex protein LldF